jgi:gamma-glutamylcyclotransferase (GGCT)/AIG2-like uncharacterized protein YtfP
VKVALLFSYGTLQRNDVQVANFGRELKGRPDVLRGYVRRILGESGHANVEPGSNPDDAVAGTLFELTEDELAAADKYEQPANYHRISVVLNSGARAWVYVSAGARES